MVLTPKASQAASSSRALVANNLSAYAWLVKGNLSAYASAADGDGSTGRVRSILPQHLQKHDVEGEEIVRLCNIAKYGEPLALGQYLQSRPARKSAGYSCHLCPEVHRPTNFDGSPHTAKDWNRMQNWTNQRDKHLGP